MCCVEWITSGIQSPRYVADTAHRAGLAYRWEIDRGPFPALLATTETRGGGMPSPQLSGLIQSGEMRCRGAEPLPANNSLRPGERREPEP